MAVLCLAVPARAGLFNHPFENVSFCGNFDLAIALPDANIFDLSPKCVTHCRQTASQCKKFVGRTAACYEQLSKSIASFQIQNCKEDLSGSDEHTCIQNEKSNDITLRAVVRSNKKTQEVACDSWEVDCESDCSGP